MFFKRLKTYSKHRRKHGDDKKREFLLLKKYIGFLLVSALLWTIAGRSLGGWIIIVIREL